MRNSRQNLILKKEEPKIVSFRLYHCNMYAINYQLSIIDWKRWHEGNGMSKSATGLND